MRMTPMGRLGAALFFLCIACWAVPAKADEGYTASNIAATTAAFRLAGGLYGMDVVATFGGGSVTLQKQAADGTTYVTAATAVTAAGYSTAYLPSGLYKLAIATATGVYVKIDRIPVTRGG